MQAIDVCYVVSDVYHIQLKSETAMADGALIKVTYTSMRRMQEKIRASGLGFRVQGVKHQGYQRRIWGQIAPVVLSKHSLHQMGHIKKIDLAHPQSASRTRCLRRCTLHFAPRTL